MHKTIILLTIFFTVASSSQRVYLIHGFGSNQLSMVRLKQELSKKGFIVSNYGYKSISIDLDTLGEALCREIAAIKEDSVSFITHSMGALVVRSMYNYIVTSARFPTIHRMVMLAPPNKGAEIADFFASNSIINSLFGPNLQKMKTDSGSYANRLPLPRRGETGVIIGIKRKGFWFNRSIDESTDGYITPQRAILGIEKDLALVNESHALVTFKKNVADLTVRFLEQGSFSGK